MNPAPEEVRVSIRRTLQLLALFSLFTAAGWSVGAYQERMDRQRVEQERLNLPRAAGSAASLLANAERLCAAVGIPDLDKCRAQHAPAASEQVGVAGTAADLAVSLREHFLLRCENFEPSHFCEQLLQQSITRSGIQPTASAP